MTCSGSSHSSAAATGGAMCFARRFHQRVGGERRVPHRRDAGLAIGFVVLDDEKLVDRGEDLDHLGIRPRSAERIEHHRRIGHGRIDRAEPVLAVQALGDEGDRLVDRALAQASGK